METLRSTFEDWFSPDTVEVVKDKAEETLKVVIQLSQKYKLVLIGAGAVVGLYWYATNTHGFFKKQGIPGPKPGLFGALGDYKKLGIIEFDKQVTKQYGKVVGVFHGRKPAYLISDIDMLKAIFVKEFPTFVNRSGKSSFPQDDLMKNSVLLAEDEHWKFVRSILSPTFTSGRMREMAPLIQKCVDNLVKNIWKISEEGTKSMKMRDVFSSFTMDVIASTAFGVDVDCQNDPDNPFLVESRKAMNPGIRVWTIFAVCSLFPFLSPVLKSLGITTMAPSTKKFFTKAVRDVVEHRKETNAPRKDLLQLMLNSHKLEIDKEDFDPDTHVAVDRDQRRGLTESEIAGNAVAFLLAGYETTSLALSYVAYCLATNPDCQDKLIAEIDRKLGGKTPDNETVSTLQYLENVFLESLRIYTIAIRISRTPSKDVWIKGQLFKAGVEVHFPIGAIHNDPEIWHNPDKFEPDRFLPENRPKDYNYVYLAFGAGPRNCIGMRLAHMEAKIPFQMFLPENRPKDYNYVYLAFGAGPRNCIGMRLAHMEAKMAIAGILQKYKFKPAPETKIPPDLGKVTNKPNDGMVLMIEKR